MTKRKPKPVAYHCHCGEHVWAPLSKGFVTFVEPHDAHHLEGRRWHAALNREGTPYARISPGKGRPGKRLHREIMGLGPRPCPTGPTADHIDLNTLNNRRGNLRLATQQQQAVNRRADFKRRIALPEGMVLPKGVYYRDDQPLRPFRAKFARTELGSYATIEAAAAAYNREAFRLHGEFARFEEAAE